MEKYDVTVIGGGPAGLAASLSADSNGARVCLIERESSLGGILKQCIHDGFGLIRFGEKLSGPEYVKRDIDELIKRGIIHKELTFVTKAEKTGNGFLLTLVSSEGIEKIETKTIVLSTGCRERTARQVKIHGTRPSGLITAGCAQNLVNIHGQMVTKNCVILGSGDIGLIMARRLTLEGARVKGVYEVMPQPSGLARNLAQCLDDYNIPLHLSHTVTRVFGGDRLEAVEISEVDEKLNPIEGTGEIVECDSLILSVGLIPENELAETLDVQIDPVTKGPSCDENFMSSVPGIFACGNCLYVYDLVDYVSEDGALTGKAAADFSKGLALKKDVMRKNHRAAAGKVSHVNNDSDSDEKIMTCIVCPNGCSLKVKTDHKAKEAGKGPEEYIIVEGNTCPKGEQFAIEEMVAPKRTISTTVATIYEDVPVLPVRVSSEIPKERIFDVMSEINKICIREPVKTGDVIIKDVLGLGADIIVTGSALENR